LPGLCSEWNWRTVEVEAADDESDVYDEHEEDDDGETLGCAGPLGVLVARLGSCSVLGGSRGRPGGGTGGGGFL